MSLLDRVFLRCENFHTREEYLFAADKWIKNRPPGYPEDLLNIGDQKLLLGLDAELLGDVFRNS